MDKQAKHPITILSEDETEQILNKLCALVEEPNPCRKRQIYDYLHSMPMSFFKGFFGTDSHPFIGNLWYPQNKNMKNMGQVFESIIQFQSYIIGKDGVNYLSTNIIPAIISFLKQGKIAQIYGVGDWAFGKYAGLEIGHHAIVFPPESLEFIYEKCFSFESFFFPRDMSWLFCITHENFNFLAGSKQFINKFKISFPNWIKYLLDYDMLGIDQQKIPAATNYGC